MIHSTFVVERRYGATPDRVFAAFADVDTKRRWFVESDHHTVEHHELDFREGGREVARFRFNENTPVAGMACLTETWYLQLIPNERLVMAQTMRIDERCISSALVTVALGAAGDGTLLTCTHQAVFFEGADGPEMREMGWKVLLDKLGGEL